MRFMESRSSGLHSWHKIFIPDIHSDVLPWLVLPWSNTLIHSPCTLTQNVYIKLMSCLVWKIQYNCTDWLSLSNHSNLIPMTSYASVFDMSGFIKRERSASTRFLYVMSLTTSSPLTTSSRIFRTSLHSRCAIVYISQQHQCVTMLWSDVFLYVTQLIFFIMCKFKHSYP